MTIQDWQDGMTRAGATMIWIVLAAWVTAFTNAANAQDVAAGENSFKKCSICHSIGEGATNKIGPELNGLDGRKSGTVASFDYSDANKNSGITWERNQFQGIHQRPQGQNPRHENDFCGH